MARTPSNMMPLGTRAPDFQLPDTVSGRTVSLEALRGETATVIMFICNHCPYVKHIDSQLVAISREYGEKGISFVGISSNDVGNYPDDAPEKMKEVAAEVGYPFPYLYDETQEVARAYDAACTPDFFVFDADLACVYRGRMDASTPRNEESLTGADLRGALDAILAGGPVPAEQLPSMGCNIKWKESA